MAEDLKNKGNVEMKKGNFTKAIEFYDDAIAMDATNGVYYNNKALACLKLGKNEKALLSANDAIRLKPQWFKGYSSKGTALCNLGRIEEAISIYQEGLKRNPGNDSLSERLKEAEALRDASSSFDAASYENTSAMSFLWTNPGSKLRTVLVSLRFLAFLNAIGVIFPFFGNSWFRFLLFSGVVRVIMFFFVNGLPSFSKVYAAKVMADVNTQDIALCIALLLNRPSVIGLLPVLLTDVYSLAYFLSQYLMLFHSDKASQLNSQLNTYIPKFNLGIDWLSTSNQEKWRFIGIQIVAMSRQIEVMLGISLIVGLVFPGRNFIGCIFFWQYLRLKYHLSPDSKTAFQTIDYQIRILTRHNLCPGIVGTIYDKVRGLLGSFVVTRSGSQQSGSLASRCVVQ